MHSRVLFIVIFIFLNVLEFGSLRSGFYFDNGLDQTEIDRTLTMKEELDMELEILELLGLPNRPKRINRSHLKKSAPKYMLDVYRSIMEKQNEENSRPKRSLDSEDSDLNLSGEEQNAIEESDIIMAFESIDHHVSNVRHEKGKRLWFNVSELSIAENIVGAELKIFQTNNHKQRKQDAIYTVTVYQPITIKGELELEYVSAINTTSTFTGWLGLNLTACLSTWVAFPNTNKGLYLAVHAIDRPGREIRLEDIGLITVKDNDETQPFMVAFLKATNNLKPRVVRDTSRKRIKRSTRHNIFLPSASKEVAFDSAASCKIHTFYVDFKDLRWQDWIIAPDGYGAYYCAGECDFPLNAHLNATNHAIVQTLIHLMIPHRFPPPCCAPTDLSPISVLYFLDDNNVILKKYKKMIVRSCGCH